MKVAYVLITDEPVDGERAWEELEEALGPHGAVYLSNSFPCGEAENWHTERLVVGADGELRRVTPT